MLDPFDDAPDKRDIAIQMARGMADDGVELRAGAGIGRHVAPNADHAVAVDGPGNTFAAGGLANYYRKTALKRPYIKLQFLCQRGRRQCARSTMARQIGYKLRFRLCGE
jgi:hypothetical protein